jgi:hypothetical protein
MYSSLSPPRRQVNSPSGHHHNWSRLPRAWWPVLNRRSVAGFELSTEVTGSDLQIRHHRAEPLIPLPHCSEPLQPLNFGLLLSPTQFYVRKPFGFLLPFAFLLLTFAFALFGFCTLPLHSERSSHEANYELVKHVLEMLRALGPALLTWGRLRAREAP